MRIRYHVAVDNRLQRSVVESGSQLFRRIVHLVRPEDGSPLENLPTAMWQERLAGTYEWHNVVDSATARALEQYFVEALIAQKDSPAPKFPTNSWRAQDLADDTHAGVGTSMEDAIEDCWARIEPNLFS